MQSIIFNRVGSFNLQDRIYQAFPELDLQEMIDNRIDKILATNYPLLPTLNIDRNKLKGSLMILKYLKR